MPFTYNSFYFNDKIRYKVHLVKLGEYHYFDFYSYGGDRFLADDTKGVTPLIRTHSFARVKWDASTLEIRHFAELDWLQSLFDQRKIEELLIPVGQQYREQVLKRLKPG